MSYVVCRNCKRFVRVNDNAPLVFDKCENCGHTLEFASDEQELQLILKNINLPKVSYHKVCSVCKSINPRETGACLYCGSTKFQLQYDLDSLRQYQESINNINRTYTNQEGSNQQFPNQQIIINPQVASVSWVFRLISVVLGIIDFFFFALIGVGFIVGDKTIPSTTVAMMPFIMQNMQSLTIVLIASLIIAGILSVFVLPRMSYRQSFQNSSLIGIIVGLITLAVSKNITVIIGAVIVCGLVTGFGGLIGEMIVQQLSKRLGT